MIKNHKELLKKIPEASLALDLAEEALRFLQPDNLFKLAIKNKTFDFSKYNNVYVVGGGKATYLLAKALNELVGHKIKAGYINVPVAKTKKIGDIIVNKAGHPFPDQNGLKGSKEILKIARKAGKRDLVICLITGGGSAMMPAPIPSITLKKKIDLTKKLLKSTANINEINIVRKHLSLIKGGNLAKACAPATVIALYISDVPNDKLTTIASGPTVLDKSTVKDAMKILKKYKITDKIKFKETPKKLNNKKIFNFIIGSNKQVLEHLKSFAEKKGYKVKTLPYFLKGEAKKMPPKLLSKVEKNKVLIAGGETVVQIKGKGFGGRNQELALASIPRLKDKTVLLTLATDGVDGLTPFPVAGAVVSEKLKKEKIQISKYLKENNSFEALKKLNCLLKTGPSGTNVGDITVIYKP
jgi:hydroxypyruvate reductase